MLEQVIGVMATTVIAMLGPNLWWLVPTTALLVTMSFPMERRGPNSSSRDEWRGFKYAPRRTVLARAAER